MRACIIISYALVCLLRKINRGTTCSLARFIGIVLSRKVENNREGGRVIFFKSTEGDVKIRELLREKRSSFWCALG